MLGHHRKTWLATARSPLAAVALLLLCAAVYLPGLFALPPVDRDECRFAQASRQMFEAHALPADQLDPRLHSGGWAVPYFTDTPRLNKPPLIYWLQVGSAWLLTLGQPLSDAIWMYRVPSVISAMVTVLATWWFGKRWLDPRAAWLAAALLAVAPIIVWDANQARADQLLVACTTVAMGALGVLAVRGLRSVPTGETRRMSTAGGWVWPLVFWFAVAAGVMAKGFVTPLLALLAVLTLSAATRRWSWIWSLRPWLGMVIVPVAVVPWLYFVAQHQGGIGPFIQQAFGEFFVRAAAGSKEGHFAPPGTHLVLLAVLFWPGSLLTLAALGHAIGRAKGFVESTSAAPGWWTRLLTLIRTPWRGRPIELFLLAWIVPMWVLFELSMAKLPHYTMPMYPAIALLSARMALRLAARRERMPKVGVAIWAAIGAALIVAIIVGSLDKIGSMQNSPSWPIYWLFVLPATGLLIWSIRAAAGGDYARACVRALGVSVCVVLPLMGTTLPARVPGSQTASLSNALRETDPSARRPIGSTYIEESVRFATRGRVVPLTDADAWSWLQADRARVAIVPDGLISSAPPSDLRKSLAGRDQQGRTLWVVWRD